MSYDRASYDDRRGGAGGTGAGYADEDRYDRKVERGYDDRRGGASGYDDRRGGASGYDDRRGGYDDRRGGYDDRRGGYDDRRGGGGYDDRRGGYGGPDRRGGYDDRRGGGYDDRRGGYGDDRRGGYDDRRGGYDDRRGGYDRGGVGGGGGRGMSMADRPRRPPPDISDLYSLLVLNVTFRTRASELTPLFQKYGEVRDCYIPRSRDSGDSRGFAFVRYSKREEAEAAIEHVNGAVVDGREIIVQFAKFGRQDAVNQAAALGVPAAEVDVAGAAPRVDPVDGDAPAVPMRDTAAPDARDDVVESRKRQLSRSPSPDRADRRSRSPEIKRARSRSPERGAGSVPRDGGDEPRARGGGSDDDRGETRRDD